MVKHFNYDEDLDSDAKVQEAKRRKLQEAKDDKGEEPRIIKLPSAEFKEPLAKNSSQLLLARKTFAASRNKKQLQGLYEAITEGASLFITTDSTIAVKVPGQHDTVLNKSDRQIRNRRATSHSADNLRGQKDRTQPPCKIHT